MVVSEQHIGRLEIDRVVTVDSWQTSASLAAQHVACIVDLLILQRVQEKAHCCM